MTQSKTQYGYNISDDSLIAERNSDGTYTLDYTNITQTKYLMYWLPYAANYYINEVLDKNYWEYKSLNAYWIYQRPPLIKYDKYNDDGSIGEFKSEMLFINAVGGSQSDDDQIFISNNKACHVSFMKGQILTRKNGKYPQIWLGEEIGIKNLIDGNNNTCLYYCWRPAATARYIPYDQEEWYTLRSLQNSETYATIQVQHIEENRVLTELNMLNPPITNPILLKGSKISFEITQCSRKKISPSLNGRIEVWHLLFTNIGHTMFNKEIVYSLTFDQDYCSNRYSAGALSWDAECRYSFSKINDDFWVAGESYMLAIFPSSFICCNCQSIGIANDYLFGTQYSNDVPIFQYQFTYQDFPILSFGYVVSQSSIVINTPNINPIPLQGGIPMIDGMLIPSLVKLPQQQYIYSLYFKFSNGLSFLYLHNTQYTDTIKQIVYPTQVSLNTNLYVNITVISVIESNKDTAWTGSSYDSIYIGNIACHSDCNTCKGPTSLDCLTCTINGTKRIFSNGECVSKCPLTRKYIYKKYDLAGAIYYMECFDVCPDKTFAVSYPEYRCMGCNSLCANCISDSVMSCTSCVLNEIDTNNIFSLYFYKGMCMNQCPLNSAYSHSKICTYSQNPSIPMVKIRIYGSDKKQSSKVNLKLSAILTNSTNFGSYQWSTFPEETTSANAEELAFVSYSGMALNMQSVQINCNIFNSRADENPLFVVAKVYDNTYTSYNYDIIELIGNKPPLFKESQLTFSHDDYGSSPKWFPTRSMFNLKIENCKDYGDNEPDIYVGVNFRASTYSIKSSLQTIPDPQLTISTLTIPIVYPFQANTNGAAIDILQVQIPPIINGRVFYAQGMPTSAVEGDLIICIQDRYDARSEVIKKYVVKESYFVSNREIDLLTFYNTPISSFNAALYIANSLSTIIIVPTISISPGYCQNDLNCLNDGVCSSAKLCNCQLGYYGTFCNWKGNELYYARKVSERLIDFIYSQSVSKSDIISDDSLIFSMSAILKGAVTSAEMLSYSYKDKVIQLCEFIANISDASIQMLDQPKFTVVVNAFSKVLEYIAYHAKTLFSNEMTLLPAWNTTAYIYNRKAIYTAKQYIETARNALYKLLLHITMGIFSTETGYSLDTPLFNATIFSDTVRSFISHSVKVKENIVIGRKDGLCHSVVPLNAFDGDGEIKIIFVCWKQPYIISDYISDSAMLYLKIYTASGDLLIPNVPIYAFLHRGDIYSSYGLTPKCSTYNQSNTATFSNLNTQAIDISQLNISDSQKAIMFPEWNPTLYKGSHLILDYTAYYNETLNCPEFAIPNINAIGNLYDGWYICNITKFGETAAILDIKPEIRAPIASLLVNTSFDLMDGWKQTIGYYTSIIITLLGIITLLACIIIDYFTISKLVRRLYNSKLTRDALLKSIQKQGEKSTNVEDTSFKKVRYREKAKDDESYKPAEGICISLKEDTLSNKDPIEDQSQSIENVTISKLNNSMKEETEMKAVATLNKDKENEKSCASQSNTEQNMTNNELLDDIKVTEDTMDGLLKYRRLVFFSHPLINLFMVTSITNYRAVRAILNFLTICINFYWAAVLLQIMFSPMNRPDEIAGFYPMRAKTLWICLVTPIFSSLMVILYSALFKISDKHIINANTKEKFNSLKKDIKKELAIRLFTGSIVACTTMFSGFWYCVRFSALYGWETSNDWLYLGLLSIVIDAVPYHLLMSYVQCAMYRRNQKRGRQLYRFRSLKWIDPIV